MKLRRILSALLLTPLLAAAACNTQTADNTTTSPTAPTSPTVTEPAFTGTLHAGGSPQILTFNVAVIGPLTVTLNSAGPPANVSVGIAIGSPTFSTTGTVCTPIATATAVAGVGAPQISGSVSTTGGYCLVVFDPGTLTADVTFSVTVAHT
jgi:hypothetical protein